MKTLATRCDANALYNFNTALHDGLSLPYAGEGVGRVWRQAESPAKTGRGWIYRSDVKVVPGDILNYCYIII